MVLFKNISANKFPTLLKNIDRDEVEVDGMKINFFAEKEHSLRFEDHQSSEWASERWSIDWPLELFRWSVNHKFQNEMQRILRKVSLKLKTYDPPYEDVYKAVRGFLRLPEYEFREYAGRDAISYILLPDYLAIKNCELQGDKLNFEIKFHPSIDTGDLRLNIIARGKKTKQSQEAFSKNSIQKYGAFRLARGSLTLENAADVQSYVFLKGRENEGPSDNRYVRNLKSTINSRFMANEILGASVEKLTTWLHGLGRNRSDDFEHSIAILFHICGFSTEWLDRGNLVEDAPDILIFCPEPQALIVGECKTDVFGWKEMRKVRDRAEILCQELKVDTYPVMFACIEPHDIDEQTRQRALNESITILSAQEIDEILKMTLRGSRARDVLKRYFQYGLKYPLE